MNTQFRQGDVLLVKVDEQVDKAKACLVARDSGRVVLAYGEVTGHAHAIFSPDVELFEETLPESRLQQDARELQNVLGNRWLVVTKPAELVHEEHGTIALDPGTYKVIRQKEYDPIRDRQVLD